MGTENPEATITNDDQKLFLEAHNTAPAATKSKPKNRVNLRKRPASMVDSDDDKDAKDNLDAARKSQKLKDQTAPLAFSTKRDTKTEAFKFESTNTIQVHDDGGATRANEIETATDRDNQAIQERILKQQQRQQQLPRATHTVGTALQAENENNSLTHGTENNQSGAEYRGMNAYRDYRSGFRRENTISAQKASGRHGPLRASANVRMSIRVDYQPDICKDYKETGYCGYGDACKFLHDRGDYKSGWELDRDWEQEQKQKEEARKKWNISGSDNGGVDAEEEEEEEEEEDGLPFACYICRKPWVECQDPVVTKCKHYFCEQCALQHNAKSSKCYVCEQPTGGIFNVAHDIVKKQKQKK